MDGPAERGPFPEPSVGSSAEPPATQPRAITQRRLEPIGLAVRKLIVSPERGSEFPPRGTCCWRHCTLWIRKLGSLEECHQWLRESPRPSVINDAAAIPLVGRSCGPSYHRGTGGARLAS